MRGTLTIVFNYDGYVGIIPAYAGNTPPFPTGLRKRRDHPRVCGEHDLGVRNAAKEWGSSPRMRGTPHDADHSRRTPGIIPAYAGNTLGGWSCSPSQEDHPRVCGEHPSLTIGGNVYRGSSPRMRGTPAMRFLQERGVGIIPAYAGNTSAVTTV